MHEEQWEDHPHSRNSPDSLKVYNSVDEILDTGSTVKIVKMKGTLSKIVPY